MNLQWWADIDESPPMNTYHQIYPIESISTNTLTWKCQCEYTPMVDINKSTLTSWYWQIYPVELIFFNIPHWIYINWFTLKCWHWWIHAFKSISTNLYWWVDINESTIDLIINLLWVIAIDEFTLMSQYQQFCLRNQY